MELIKNVGEQQDLVERSIKKYGFFAEHNYHHYRTSEVDGDKNVFFSFENDYGVMSNYHEKSNTWDMFAEVLAPEEKRYEVFKQFLDHILLEKHGKKLTVEVTKPFRKILLEKLRGHLTYRLCNINYSLIWPLFNLKEFNPALPGKTWKKVRNLCNYIMKRNNIKILDPKECDNEELKSLVLSWKKQRTAKDLANYEPILKLIDSNFKGCDLARIITIKGKAKCITAGWRIPNSNNYYSAYSVYDYNFPGLGVYSNIDDLKNLKKKGFEYADFGGSDKPLMDFKNKFRPESTYKTFIFSIKNKEV